MAISGTQIWNVNASGSDTNGGGFDYAQAVNGFTDLNCTVGTSTAPVVTSSSYVFVAGDINHWVYINSGTNWIPGWYQIASVGGGAATLRAAVGQARMAYNQLTGIYAGANGSLNTGGGCSSVATNTNGATWTIDRSYTTTAYASGNVATTNPAGTGFTPGGAYTAGQQDVGNTVNITGGTGATTGWYTITSVSGGVWTLDRSAGASATAITWKMGGGLATIGGVGAVIATASVGANNQYVYVTGNQSLTNNSTNVSGGVFSLNSAFYIIFEGYKTVPGDLAAWPTIDTGAQTAVTLFLVNSSTALLLLKHLFLNGLSGSGNSGINAQTGPCEVEDCMFTGFILGGMGYAGASPPLAGNICRGCYLFNADLSGATVVDLCESDTSAITVTIYISRTLVHNSAGNGIGLVTPTPGVVEGVTVYKAGSNGITNGTIGTHTQVLYSNVVVYGTVAQAINNAGPVVSPADRLLNVATGSIGTTRTRSGATSPLYDPLNLQILLTVDPFQNLNGGVTSTNGTNLTVDGSNPLKVTPDVNAPWLGVQAADLGLKLIVLPGSNINAGIYTITSVGSNFWILNASPAATGTSGISWRISDFRPNNLAGGGALLRGKGYPIPTQAG